MPSLSLSRVIWMFSGCMALGFVKPEGLQHGVQAGRGCRPKGCVCGVSGGIKIALIEFENAFGWIIGGDGGRLEDFVVERDREFLLLNPGWIVISRRLPVIPVRASASRPSASVSGSAFNSMRTMMKPPTSLKFSN